MAFSITGNVITDTSTGKKVDQADSHLQAIAEAQKRAAKGEGHNERLENKRGRKDPPPPAPPVPEAVNAAKEK